MTMQIDRLAFYRGWWKRRVSEASEHVAFAVCIPEDADRASSMEGYLFSAAFRNDTRTVAFSDRLVRDRFLRLCPSADKCEDPLG